MTPRCAHPGCKADGKVRVKGNTAWWCWLHKPIGKIA
jgi:hypothetical protein